MVEASGTRRIVQKTWLGGMNTLSADDTVSNNEAALLENISLMDRVESLTKVSGSILYAEILRNVLHKDTTEIQSMFAFTKADKTSVQMFQASDPTGFFIGTFIPNSFTEITAATVGIALPVTDWISHAGKVYFVTGENAVYTWDSIATTYTRDVLPLGFMPSVIEMYKGRAYYSGDPADTSRVIFSKPLLPTQFNTPTDFVDVPDSLGDGIIDLQGLGDRLVVLKKRSIHEIIGSPPREIREIAAIGVGAVSKSTVQKTSIGIVFLSERGIYTYTGGDLKKLTLKVEPLIDVILRLSQNNFSSVFYDNTYHLFYQSTESTFIDKGVSIALDALEIAGLGITTLDNFNCNNNIVLSSFDANNDWLASFDKSNIILKMNNSEYPFFYKSEAEPAVPLIANVITKWTDFEDPTRIKDVRSIHFVTQRPLIDMCYILEYFAYGELKRFESCIDEELSATWQGELGTEGNAVWNGFSWEPANKYQYKIILPAGIVCERCRLLITSANSNEIFSLMSLEYHAIARRTI